MDDVKFKIARVGLHHFEEPCISGSRGSGTIFFSGCNLKCAFCQNYEISRGGKGLEISGDQLVGAMRYLEELGAHNINLVTPSNWANNLQTALEKAKRTIKIPIVWNSSGYETVSNLKKTEGLVDVYMPDFKYSDDELALRYSNAKNYFEIAANAVEEMRRQQPLDVFDEDGTMLNGVIVRHLVLPAQLENTRGVLNAVASIDRKLYVSVMGQYFPTEAVKNIDCLDRRLYPEEYDEAVEYFFDAGLKNGFTQELGSATEEYVPSFDLEKLAELIKKF